MLSCALFVTTVGGWATVKHADSKIHKVTIKHTIKQPPAPPPGTVNYLLVGADNRAGLAGERSDTIMIAHLDTNGSTTLLSFPRDTLVNIPGHGRNKINAAISEGGVGLLIDTLEQLTGIPIAHYMSIDFSGFKTMADAVGGVQICISKEPADVRQSDNLHDKESGFSGHYGIQTVSGDQALGYVRARYSLPYYDIDRIRRQQAFLASLFTKATHSSVLLNPSKVVNLLDALTGSLQIDKQTSTKDLINLADRLRGLSSGRVRLETIPTHTALPADGAVDDQGQVPPFGDVQIYDPAQLNAVVAPLRTTQGSAPSQGGTASPSPTGATPTPAATLSPSQVSVEVLNGTHQQGLAKTAADSLQARGFEIAGAVNSTTKGNVASEIRYSAGNADAARTLAAYVPGAELVQDATLGHTLHLVLGSSFTAVSASPAAATGAGTVEPAADVLPAATTTSTTTSTTPDEAPANCPY